MGNKPKKRKEGLITDSLHVRSCAKAAGAVALWQLWQEGVRVREAVIAKNTDVPITGSVAQRQGGGREVCTATRYEQYGQKTETQRSGSSLVSWRSAGHWNPPMPEASQLVYHLY